MDILTGAPIIWNLKLSRPDPKPELHQKGSWHISTPYLQYQLEKGSSVCIPHVRPKRIGRKPVSQKEKANANKPKPPGQKNDGPQTDQPLHNLPRHNLEHSEARVSMIKHIRGPLVLRETMFQGLSKITGPSTRLKTKTDPKEVWEFQYGHHQPKDPIYTLKLLHNK